MFFRVILVCIIATQVLFSVSGCERLKDFRSKAYYEKASALYEKGQYTRAIEECNNALVFDEENVGTLVMLGDCYYALKQYKRATAYYRKAFNIGLDSLEILAKAADAYTQAGKYGQTVFLSANMLIERPDHDYARYLNARARIRTRKVQYWSDAGTILQPLLDSE